MTLIRQRWWYYAEAIIVIVACTLVAYLMVPFFALANVIMVYLVGVVVVSGRCGRGPSILASILSVAAFDYFFVPPVMTFAVSDTQYIVTFGVMLLVAIIITTLTARIKEQAQTAKNREYRTAQLYDMSRARVGVRGPEQIADVASRYISALFDSPVVVLFTDATGGMTTQPNATVQLSAYEAAVARWVYDHSQAAGLSTTTLPNARGLYLPLAAAETNIGVLGVYPGQADRFTATDQLEFLQTVAHQMALAIERARLEAETERVQIEIETERLRNALLSSVSHDLRTPLASITGAVSSLLEDNNMLDSHTRHELAQVAFEEAERLNRLLSNLLEMTRLEAGSLEVRKEWQPLDEVVGTALSHLNPRLDGHTITTNIPPDLPPIPLDDALIAQVIINLLENAVKYTPAGSNILLSASADSTEALVEVADRGPGLPPGNEQRVFDKFYRVRPTTASGVGLGLTVCAGIIKVHGGRIWAENRPGGGAVFRFTLPLDGGPPEFQSKDE